MADLFEKQRNGDILVPIRDNKHKLFIHRFIGATEVYAALEAVKGIYSKTPGWNSAMAIVEKEIAELKVAMMQANVRAVAKAGVDLAAYRVLSVDGENVICRPIDVADEEASGGGEG